MMDFPHTTETGIVIDRNDGDMPAQVNATLSPLYPEFVTCWRVITMRDEGTEYAICFVYETASYAEYFTSGWFDSLEQAITFFEALLKENPMNLLKNDQLFPHIKGVMLKEKPVTLTLSGKANVVQSQGNKARVEIFFSDHKKSAIISPAQSLVIIEMYGPDCELWAGKRVELYGEFGNWFGKDQWGIRVSPKVPAAPKKKGYSVDAEESLKIVENAEKAAREREGLDFELDDEKPPFAQDAGYQD